MIHLDTGFLIRALLRGSAEDARLRGWLLERMPVRVSALAWAEFLCGPLDAEQRALAEHLVGEPIPLLAQDASAAARLFNDTGRRRGSLTDCLIAATALRAGAALATTNARDFRRLQAFGLRLVKA